MRRLGCVGLALLLAAGLAPSVVRPPSQQKHDNHDAASAPTTRPGRPPGAFAAAAAPLRRRHLPPRTLLHVCSGGLLLRGRHAQPPPRRGCAVRVLVLLWKMGANKKPAEIQKDEWIAGCHKLKLDSIDKFRKLVPSLETGFMERDEFGDFYKVRALFSLDVYSFICG